MNRDRSPAVRQDRSTTHFDRGDRVVERFGPPSWSSILVADPQAALCQLLVTRLQSDFPTLEIAHAATIQDVRVHLTRHPQTLVLSALRFPDGGVWDLAEFMEAVASDARILFWSDQEVPFLARQCAAMTIGKCVPRSCSLEQLLHEIGTIVGGASAHDSRSSVSTIQAPVAAPLLLSPRQKEVLLLLAQGLAVKQVAAQLNRSMKTVDSLKFRLMRALGLHDRVELTRLAIREGLIDP